MVSRRFCRWSCREAGRHQARPLFKVFIAQTRRKGGGVAGGTLNDHLNFYKKHANIWCYIYFNDRPLWITVMILKQ